MSSSLEYRGVTKSFRNADSPAVRQIDLTVAAGEIVALVGESGSGKTTLLRLATGLESPDVGEVFVGGECVAGPGRWVPPERRGVGLVFQDGALFPHLTVSRNIGYGLSRRTLDPARGGGTGDWRAARRRRIEAMLALVGLEGYDARFPHELSGGERQRVALARALAPQPKVILLDEPFSSLDPSLRRSLRGEVRRILEQASATAILVTHDPDDALTVGNRVAVLREGRLEQVGAAADVYHHPRNGYCARLFGPANEVTLAPDSTPRWIRPERMTLTTRRADHDEGRWPPIEVMIDSVRDTGRYAEILVRPVDEPLQGALWTVHAGSVDPALHPGGTGWVSVEAPCPSPHTGEV